MQCNRQSLFTPAEHALMAVVFLYMAMQTSSYNYWLFLLFAFGDVVTATVAVKRDTAMPKSYRVMTLCVLSYTMVAMVLGAFASYFPDLLSTVLKGTPIVVMLLMVVYDAVVLCKISRNKEEYTPIINRYFSFSFAQLFLVISLVFLF